MILDVLSNDKGEGLQIVSADFKGSEFGSIRISGDSKSLLYTWYIEDYGTDKINYTIKDKYGHRASSHVLIVRKW